MAGRYWTFGSTGETGMLVCQTPSVGTAQCRDPPGADKRKEAHCTCLGILCPASNEVPSPSGKHQVVLPFSRGQLPFEVINYVLPCLPPCWILWRHPLRSPRSSSTFHGLVSSGMRYSQNMEIQNLTIKHVFIEHDIIV